MQHFLFQLFKSFLLLSTNEQNLMISLKFRNLCVRNYTVQPIKNKNSMFDFFCILKFLIYS